MYKGNHRLWAAGGRGDDVVGFFQSVGDGFLADHMLATFYRVDDDAA